MIRIADSFKLARTKLKTHRVRTTLTVLIASLLFGVMFFVLIVSSGIFGSLANFSKTGLTSRYIASGNYAFRYDFYQNKEVMDIAERLYKQELETRKLEARRLGLDESVAVTSIQPPVEGGETKDQFRYLNMSNPISIKAIEEYTSKQKQYTADDFIDLAKNYNPKTTYKMTAYSSTGSLEIMKDGKENFTSDRNQNMESDYKKQPMFRDVLTKAPDSIVDSYLLKNNTWKSDSGRIPVIISQMRAEQILGLTAPSDSASAEDKLAYADKIRSQIVDHVITVCYRNSVSDQQIQSAIDTAAEIEKNKGRADYQAPALQYGLPDATSCGAATIKKDSRTATEKNYQAKMDQFTAKFTTEDTIPKQAKVEYQVVGVAPDPMYVAMSSGGLLDVRGLLSMILMNSAPTLSIPNSYFDKLPENSIFNTIYKRDSDDIYTKLNSELGLVEFNTAGDLKNFIDKENCILDEQWGSCKEDVHPYKPFYIQSFGSNSAAIDDFRQSFMRFFWIALAIIMGLAVVILGFTISRAIADGRRETAVFRAIGFKRLDIASVYLTYSLLLALLVAITGFVIGVVAALILDSQYWVSMTAESRLAFGYNENPATFHLFGFDWQYIVVVFGGILVAALISSLLPLIRNVRRNPIRDMRDE